MVQLTREQIMECVGPTLKTVRDALLGMGDEVTEWEERPDRCGTGVDMVASVNGVKVRVRCVEDAKSLGWGSYTYRGKVRVSVDVVGGCVERRTFRELKAGGFNTTGMSEAIHTIVVLEKSRTKAADDEHAQMERRSAEILAALKSAGVVADVEKYDCRIRVCMGVPQFRQAAYHPQTGKLEWTCLDAKAVVAVLEAISRVSDGDVAPVEEEEKADG